VHARATGPGVSQRDGVPVTAGVGDQLGQLFGRDHAFVDRDVRHFVRSIHADAGDVRILAKALLDAGDAGLAGERAGWDREHCRPVAAGMARENCLGGSTGSVTVLGIMRRAHGRVASERVISPSLTSHSPRVTVRIVTATDLKTRPD